MKKALASILCACISCFLLVGCQETKEPEHIHNWKQADCITPKTCIDCGITEGTENGHNWKEINYAMTCTQCGTIDETVVIAKPPLYLDPTMDADDIQRYINLYSQNNVQNDATFYIKDGWIYGQSWQSNGQSQFIKVRTDFSDWTVLDTGFARHINIVDNYIYYMLYKNNNEYGIYKMKTSGEGKEQLVKAFGSMQIVGEHIYYTDNTYETDLPAQEDCHLYRCDLDGTNIVEIIPKPTFHFFVFDNGIIYQDDKDNCSLHTCYVDGTGDVKLNDQISYWPLYDGQYIYYVNEEVEDDKLVRNIWRMRRDGSDNELLAPYSVSQGIVMSDDHLYFVYGDDNDRIYRINKDGSNLTLITQDTNIMYPQLFDNLIKYTKYDKNYRYIEGNIFCDYDGSGKWEFEK